VLFAFDLAATGLPLLFSDREWAGVVARFGGIQTAGVAHRFFAS
jgi:hypothetical protein